MKSIIWEKPILYSEIEHIKLPKTFFFIIDYIDGVLCGVGISSSALFIQWAELKMVDEGF